MLLTGLGVRIWHEASCPEVDPLLCETAEIPVHAHDQRIAWGRLTAGATVGFGEGWQGSVEIPFDVRLIRVAYLTLDGAAYDPPYDDIHHRDEVLSGLVDGTAWVRRYLYAGPVLLGPGLGVSLPLGRTEEDPYALTEQGLRHQHQQLGAGAFIPLIGLDAIYARGRWGGMGALSARLPVYENGKGYRAPATVSLTAGPTLRSGKSLQWWLAGEGVYEGAERWSGEPYGGKIAANASVAAFWSAAPAMTFQALARTTLYQHDGLSGHHTDEDGTLRQPLVVTVGMSWQK